MGYLPGDEIFGVSPGEGLGECDVTSWPTDVTTAPSAGVLSGCQAEESHMEAVCIAEGCYQALLAPFQPGGVRTSDGDLRVPPPVVPFDFQADWSGGRTLQTVCGLAGVGCSPCARCDSARARYEHCQDLL
jgi:hypothetical protein